ncbi:MAG: excinuclease ABC subunit UvrC [Clostridia bacterium]
MTQGLQFKIDHLPESPGCYIMRSEGEVIYVGKAVNLKNRVRQYFQSSRGHTPKVRAMVARIDDFDTVLVNGELEALILECNLIKRYRPFYNILLKDDKQYPYIAIDLSEPFPRMQLRRKVEKDGARYFGPYKGASVVREVLDVVRMVFPVRVCQKQLKPDPAVRPCVHYAVGQCLAPCAAKVSPMEYGQLIQRVIEFLSGKYDPVLDELRARMSEASAQTNYERAAVYRDRIRAVEGVMQRQRASMTGGGDQDVLACAAEGADAVVERLTIRDGKLIEANTYVLERAGDEAASEVLTSFILQHYEEGGAPREILLAVKADDMEVLSQLLGEMAKRKVTLHVPERGEKKRLIELCEKNLQEAITKRAAALRRSYARTHGAVRELADALGLVDAPRRIEGYDISNTQGAQSIGAMVVMIDGTCEHGQYRHFRIKSVEGANDFASMYEVLLRRFKHGLAELATREEAGLPAVGGSFSDLPDLILIDGGPGQVKFAQDAMHEVGLEIPMFGLAERIDEIVLPHEKESLLLDRHSEALHLIQRLRDEAHRFGITQHRKLRAKASIASALDGIPGIGPKKKKALLKQFKTIELLKAAEESALMEAEGIGPELARVIHAHFLTSSNKDGGD